LNRLEATGKGRQLAEKYDAIVIGAGIAGLGVAGLLQRAGMNTVCVEKDKQAGGRMQGYDLEGGWRLDIGLHMAELGDASSSDEIVKAVGKEVEWARFSDTVEIYRGGKWQTLQEMIIASPEDIEEIKRMMKLIARIDDAAIEAADLLGWGDWLDANTTSAVTKELFCVNGMIMTTVPDPYEMSAGETLYIARDNLLKKRNFLTAAYPKGGMLGIIEPQREAFEEAGGTLMLNTEVDSVLFDGNKAKGVAIKKKSLSPYTGWFYMDDLEMIEASVVVCALPLWNLDAVLDMNPETAVLPDWWLKRYEDLKYETTGLIGYTIALTEPVFDRPNFLSALELDHTGMPFQAFVPSAFDPGVAPEGKSLMQTDCVVEVDQIFDKFEHRDVPGDRREGRVEVRVQVHRLRRARAKARAGRGVQARRRRTPGAGAVLRRRHLSRAWAGAEQRGALGNDMRGEGAREIRAMKLLRFKDQSGAKEMAPLF
jgi:phytoene dehydrogenase-like protein